MTTDGGAYPEELAKRPGLLYVRKAIEALSEGGLCHLLMQLVRKLSAPLLEFGSVAFFARQLDEASAESMIAPGRNVDFASPAEVDRLVHGYDHTKSAEALLGRFRSGHRCVIGRDGHSQVVHCRWVATRRAHIPELDMDLLLGSGEAYFYDGYTRRDSRGQGIDAAVRDFIFRRLRAEGFNRVYSYARGDNPIGLRVVRRWQQSAERLWYIRLRGLPSVVIGKRALGSSRLVRTSLANHAEAERFLRIKVWREWFEGWLREPLAKRSTGFSALPDEFLAATADNICALLRLDADADVVLDVGCDSAMVSRFVARRCKRFVGVDFIPGMLADLTPEAREAGPGRRAFFLAADGRCLPFAPHAFTKAYCSAVLHTLPNHEDGLRMIEELVRVCRPGGAVLVAAVPDRGKRVRRYLQAWREAGLLGKAELLVSAAVPQEAKQLLRRLFRLPRRQRLVFLDYDLKDMKRKFDERGLACDVVDFPPDYWSRDFRNTRSNLLIRIPLEHATLTS